MLRAVPLSLLLLAAGPAAAAPEPLGRFATWGAFRAGGLCYAMSEPARRQRVPGPYVTITTEPKWRRFRELHVRLPRPAKTAQVLIGDATFPLLVQGLDAWPVRPTDGARIAARLRKDATMRVEHHTIGGRYRTDYYPAAGAASAIDAADIACLR